MDGGEGTSANAGYTLSGTIGQPEAHVLSGGDYALAGGYRAGVGLAAVETIYLPYVMK